MRLHRFFSQKKLSEKIQQKIGSGNQNDTSDLIAPKLVTDQWRRVFRFGPGDRVILFDGFGKDFVCEIKEYKGGNGDKDSSTLLKVIEVRENIVKPARNVSLFAAVVKKDTFEWIAEKATELGVSDIVPVIAERSEKKNLNMERLEKIVIEAAEQSGRGTVPQIEPIIDFADALANITKRKQPAIVFDPSGIKFSEKDFNFGAGTDTGVADEDAHAGSDISIAVFIGPEGGWSPEELKLFEAAKIPVLSLGPQILRAETAAIAALSRLVF